MSGITTMLSGAGMATVFTVAVVAVAGDRMPAFVAGPGEGMELNQLGHVAREKVTADQTGGAYYAFALETGPGLGIPPHVHESEDEIVYVAAGDYEIVLGDQTVRAGPGTLLNFARGTPHGFANVGTDPGMTIWTVVPGASFQAFFRELALVPPGPPDPVALGELFGRYGITLLPPPG